MHLSPNWSPFLHRLQRKVSKKSKFSIALFLNWFLLRCGGRVRSSHSCHVRLVDADGTRYSHLRCTASRAVRTKIKETPPDAWVFLGCFIQKPNRRTTFFGTETLALRLTSGLCFTEWQQRTFLWWMYVYIVVVVAAAIQWRQCFTGKIIVSGVVGYAANYVKRGERIMSVGSSSRRYLSTFSTNDERFSDRSEVLGHHSSGLVGRPRSSLITHK